jgi:micrococcal nuclease
VVDHRTRPSARRFPLALLVALVGLLPACRAPGPPAGPGDAVVTKDVDGDTVDVSVHGHHERLRLIGIDTPETKDPRKPVQCYGPEASARTAALLPVGTAVRLQRDEEPRDDYGRLLAYVYRADDGLFVNLELAREGMAVVLSIKPNTAFAPVIAAAVDRARAARLGLWGHCR